MSLTPFLRSLLLLWKLCSFRIYFLSILKVLPFLLGELPATLLRCVRNLALFINSHPNTLIDTGATSREHKGLRLLRHIFCPNFFEGSSSHPGDYQGSFIYFSFWKNFSIFPGCPLLPNQKKSRAKGALRELKIVQSVSRRGADIVATEEVKTPRRVAQKASSSTQRNQSSSPTKRRKLDGWDDEPIPCHLEGPNGLPGKTNSGISSA
jgi:hypothetical protein